VVDASVARALAELADEVTLAGCSNEGASPESAPPIEQVVEPDDPFPVGSSGPYVVEAHGGVKFATIDSERWATTPRNDGPRHR
jgi:hypothetical protein